MFVDKVMYLDIGAMAHFSDYDSSLEDFDEGVLYFTQKFQDYLVDDEFNEAYIHVTCVTNSTKGI